MVIPPSFVNQYLGLATVHEGEHSEQKLGTMETLTLSSFMTVVFTASKTSSFSHFRPHSELCMHGEDIIPKFHAQIEFICSINTCSKL